MRRKNNQAKACDYFFLPAIAFALPSGVRGPVDLPP
jgi:hypothetical protein